MPHLPLPLRLQDAHALNDRQKRRRTPLQGRTRPSVTSLAFLQGAGNQLATGGAQLGGWLLGRDGCWFVSAHSSDGRLMTQFACTATPPALPLACCSPFACSNCPTSHLPLPSCPPPKQVWMALSSFGTCARRRVAPPLRPPPPGTWPACATPRCPTSHRSSTASLRWRCTPRVGGREGVGGSVCRHGRLGGWVTGCLLLAACQPWWPVACCDHILPPLPRALPSRQPAAGEPDGRAPLHL